MTHLLRDALGGNCRTVLIATVSPAQRHASQTSSTLAFATACMRVVNSSRVNIVRGSAAVRPWVAPTCPSVTSTRKEELARAREQARQLPWILARPGDARCPGGRVMFDGISCLVFGNDTARDAVLGLHGYPSEAKALTWLAPALVHGGLYACFIDMPGCGETQGPCLKTRSEYNLVEGGPADVVRRVLRAMGRSSATLLGNDWGGGIALSMACSAKHRMMVDKVVTIHASYAEREKGDLVRGIKCDVMVLWAQDDNFHPWPKFKFLAKGLRGKLGKRYTECVVKRSDDARWSASHRQHKVVKFITGVDYLPAAQRVEKPVDMCAVGADGRALVARQGVVFRDQVVDPQIFQSRDTALSAATTVAKANKDGTLDAMMKAYTGGGGEQKRSAVILFGHLPMLDPSSVSARRLLDMGLWDQAAATASASLAAACAEAPRYFEGRRLLAQGEFVRLVAMPEVIVTLTEVTESAAVVEVVRSRNGGRAGRRLGVPLAELLAINQRHVLPVIGTVMKLEDGLFADYAAPLMRAKMAQVALAISPCMRRIGVAVESEDWTGVEGAQCEAVRAIRGCLDVTTFERGDGSRGRERDRYAKDDVARMAVYGEGHCRTCSSCIAPFLYAFQDVLGLDLLYRMDEHGRHQWLEFHVRPSMRAFVCDIYRDEGVGGGHGDLLAQPIEDAYSSEIGLWPSTHPTKLSGQYQIEVAPFI